MYKAIHVNRRQSSRINASTKNSFIGSTCVYTLHKCGLVRSRREDIPRSSEQRTPISWQPVLSVSAARQQRFISILYHVTPNRISAQFGRSPTLFSLTTFIQGATALQQRANRSNGDVLLDWLWHWRRWALTSCTSLVR